MGDRTESTDVVIVNSIDEGAKSKLDSCESKHQNWFFEDYDASLGPSDKGRGFIIRYDVRTKAFLPDSSCEAMPHGKSGCAVFGEDVCLQLVHLQPTVQSSSSGHKNLSSTNQNGMYRR